MEAYSFKHDIKFLAVSPNALFLWVAHAVIVFRKTIAKNYSQTTQGAKWRYSDRYDTDMFNELFQR